jgi:uncharacterized membrane protein YebE (DUF533 family)
MVLSKQSFYKQGKKIESLILQNRKPNMEKSDLHLTHLNNLVYLAKIDHHFDDRERDLIFTIGRNSGFDENEISDVIENPHISEISHPESTEEQFDYLFNAVNMMMVDGRLYQKEMDYCIEVALKLGYRKVIVTVLIRAIEDGLKLEMDVESIKKEAFDLISE